MSLPAPSHPKSSFSKGVAPGALPFIGHGLQILRRPLEFMISLPEYGDLVAIRMGPRRAYAVCHPELLHQVLSDDRTFDKGGPLFERTRDFMGNGLITCTHDDHRRQRRLVQPAFHRRHLASYCQVVERELEKLQEPWREGRTIDAYREFYGLGINVVMRTLFSSRVRDRTVEEIKQSYDVVVNNIVRMMLPDAVRRLPTLGNRRFHAALDTLDTVVAGIVEDYRHGGADHGDLLSLLLSAKDEGGTGISDRELRDQIITMLAAGAEAGAAALTWAVWLLAEHPDVLAQLQDEVDTVLDGRAASWADLPSLGYTENVVTEVLRLYGSGWILTRVTRRNAELAGCVLPAGTIVVYSPYAIHRSPGVYDQPEVFNPDRWKCRRPSELPRGSFVPFGHAARKCVGDAQAMAEAVLALATIVSRWNWDVCSGVDVRPARRAPLLAPRRMPLRLHSRQRRHDRIHPGRSRPNTS
jgi:pentalenene oxygenase